MITNFALSLSFEGIELLHRVPRGWRRIGRVDVTSGTLDADLADLREKAEALAPDGLRTKLIIPLDQIKYVAIDSTQTTDADIAAELDGSTPYSLDELVIDVERFGGRTHIAAVAKETLQEAEAFAAAHGFKPVAFVAVPEPFTFQKEVFFGPTSMMAEVLGPDVEAKREDLPVMIVGTRIKSRLLVFDLPEEVQEEAYRDDLATLLAPKDTPTSNEVAEEQSPEPEDMQVEMPPKQQIWVDAVPAEHYQPVMETPAPAEPATPVVPVNPTLAALPLLDRIIPEVHQPPAQRAKAPLVAAKAKTTGATPKLSAAAPAANRTTAPAPKRDTRTPLIAAGIGAAALLLGGLVWSQMGESETAPATEVAVVPNEVAPAPAEPETVVAATPELPDVPPIIPDVAVGEFGLNDATATALPSIAALDVFSAAAAPAPIVAAEADLLPRPIGPQPAPPAEQTAEVEVAPRPTGQVLSPDEAAQIYAATGVWQRAPRFFDLPTGVIPFDFVAPAGTLAPERVAQPALPVTDNLETDLSFLSPANPPPPEAVFPRDENGFILATPEGTLTPEGALVIAGLPDLAITPRPELTQADLDRMALLAPAPEGVVIIAGPPPVNPPLRPADAALPVPEDAPADDAEVAAAEDAPLLPDAQEDSLTPGSVGLAGLELQNSGAVALDNGAVAADDPRPQLRPNGLAPPSDPATPDITAIIAGIEAEAATLRFDSSTSLAVAQSIRPDRRPGGFDTVVASALARAATRPAATTPAPAVAATVAPQNYAPVPGGVARAATQEDAIRLREINLIGVYGRPNARRALVRLSNGRYVRVEVGSALDGGQVTAIGDSALNYVKRGRTYAIELPSG